MFLTQKLNEYYGRLSEDKVRFINEHTKGLKDKQIETLYQQIIKEYPSKEAGLPEDEDRLVDMLVVKKKSKGVVWSHCRVCNSNYDYKFMFCPVCYRNEGVKRNEMYVQTADEFPQGVIRYNCTYEPMGKGDADCLKCKTAAEGETYCKYYGVYNFHCKSEDFRECPCKQCCSIAKHANQKFDEQSGKLPLDKVGNKMV